MQNIWRIPLSLMLYLIVALSSPGAAAAKTGEYLIGIFGIPEGNFEELRKAGINALLVRDFELQRAKGLNLKKIYVMGIHPGAIKKGLSEAKLEERLKFFKGAGDAYDYYLGDDLNCKHVSRINSIKQHLGVKRGIVGVLQGLECYPEEDILKYHYPLMRRKMTLSEMLLKQVGMAHDIHASNRKLYICPQAHLQLWYLETIKNSNMSDRAKLYPDGQVTRMLIYYALATNADGYFLYDYKGLSGEWARERLLGAAQAILETKPLTRGLAKATDGAFFQKAGVFGTKISGADYDLFFVFNADYLTHYHPTTNNVKVNLNDVVTPKTYKAVYKYSPLGSKPVTGTMEIPQDHALILVGFKDSPVVESLKLDAASLALYAEILQARADKLSANLTFMGMSVPRLKMLSSPQTAGIESILKYIDELNELKRNDWLKRTAGQLPLDGDVPNRLYWKRLPLIAQKNQLFNFYYR
jgi:hypothetical protein